MKYLLVIYMCLFSFMTFAQDAISPEGEVVEQVVQPESVEQVLQLLPVIIDAAKSSQWLLLGALIALIGTFVARKFILPKLKLGSGVLPLVSALIGCLGGVGLAVSNGAEPVAAALAVLSGPLASSLWDGGIKYFLRK